MLDWTYKAWEEKANFDQFQYIFLDKNLKYGTVCVFLLLLLLVSSSGVQFPNFTFGSHSVHEKVSQWHGMAAAGVYANKLGFKANSLEIPINWKKNT